MTRDFPAVSRKSLLVLETVPWEAHLLSSMEIALAHAKNGWDVDLYFFCEASPFPNLSKRSRWWAKSLPAIVRSLLDLDPHLRTMSQFRAWASRQDELSLRVHVVPRKTWASQPVFPEKVPSQEKLKSLKIRGKPAGTYLLSSLISLTSEPDVNPKKHRRLFRNLMTIYLGLNQFVSAVLARNSYDLAVVFNGRFADSGAFLAALQDSGCERVLFHERGGFAEPRYTLSEGTPHDFQSKGKMALREWNELDSEVRLIQVGETIRFLESADEFGGLAFRRISGPKSTEPALDTDSPIVVFFTSTEGEFASLAGPNPRSEYRNQLTALKALNQACLKLGLSLVVRVHPNVSDSSRSERYKWNRLLAATLRKAIVFDSKSRVSSYKLMEAASLVCVWHSTMGLEAVWRGKPALAFSETAYSWAGSEIEIAKGEDYLASQVEGILGTRPNPKSVLPYARYMRFGGYPFEHLDYASWAFEGTRPRVSRVIRSLLRGGHSSLTA